jgi:hypothetical protein
MANSSAVSSGDLATADQINNVRDDAISTCSGHAHDGVNGRGDAAFTLAVSGVPLTLENTTDGTSNQVLLLQGDNATRADGDEIYLSFNLDDDGGNSHEFARITGEAVDVSDTSEDGQLRFGVSVAGTMTDVFTINSSIGGATSISYEVDAFTIKGEEGGAGVLYLFADQGDDAGDEWRVNVADGGVMTFANDIASAGSYVTHMTLTPNSTVASSTVAFAGNVTVASDLTVSGGCITLACSKIFSGGDTTSLNLIDAIDATTEATIEAAIDTLSNLTTTGALAAGSIACGFGAIDNGTSDITSGGTWTVDVDATGTDGTGLSAAGTLRMGASQDLRIYHGGSHNYITSVTGDLVITTDGGSAAGIILDAEDDTIEIKYSGTVGATFGTGGLNLACGDAFSIDCASVLNATTLGSNVVSSSLTSIGTLGALTVDNVLINGTTIGHTCDTDLITVGDQLVTIAGDLTISGGCITLTGAATDVDLIDDNACALSFDAAGQAGILAIDTQDCAEGVKMSGKLTVTGAISTTGAVTVGVCDTGLDVKFFGASAGAYLIYDQAQDQLEIRGAAADATTSTGKLLLTTAQTAITANDVIGSINFQAPLETGGTDAVAIAAGIRAVAGATFTNAVNNTDLIFYTGKSEAATEKFRFTADGEIGIGGTNYGTNGQVLTSGGPCNPAAWEDAAGGPTEAADTDMEDQGAGNPNRYVSPEVTKHHPGVAKAHVLFEQDGTHDKIGSSSYNVNSVTDGDSCPGNTDIVWITNFANAQYTTVGMTEVDKVLMVADNTIATTGITIRVKGRESNNNEDAGEVMIVAFGTQ